MARISDFLETLSAAEREQFKDVIEESIQREASIQESARRADLALMQLAEQQRLLVTKIRDLEQAGQRLLDSVGRVYLRTVPTPTKMN
jgi:hypothetical protein